MRFFLSFTCAALVLLSLSFVSYAQDVVESAETTPVVPVPETVVEPDISPQPNADDTVPAATGPQLPDAPVIVSAAPETMPTNPFFDMPADKLPPILASMKKQLDTVNPNIDVNDMPSLFFTKWEHDLIIESRLGATNRPSEGSVPLSTTATTTLEDLGNPGEPGPREIILSGIAYVSSKNWTIWLNGTRITPTAIPRSVMDLKVFKDHIELDWLDTSTNQIYPIKLRAHERFNLDTRMFLTGN